MLIIANDVQKKMLHANSEEGNKTEFEMVLMPLNAHATQDRRNIDDLQRAKNNIAGDLW